MCPRVREEHSIASERLMVRSFIVSSVPSRNHLYTVHRLRGVSDYFFFFFFFDFAFGFAAAAAFFGAAAGCDFCCWV
eukprot:COSAG02_NODE_3825_length_6182_cov_5.458491_2_plen_77_part_00